MLMAEEATVLVIGPDQIRPLHLLAELADLASELQIKSELFEQLAEVALLLDESLKLVNAPAALGDDFDFESFREGVETALETGAEVLNALREVLDGND
jgi:hypothetical protein